MFYYNITMCINKKHNISICLIDESLNLSDVQNLLSTDKFSINTPKLTSGPEIIKNAFLPIQHGTICSAILIESLIRLGINDSVSITYCPITDESGNSTLSQLVKCFDYCDRTIPDIISLSAGLFSRVYSIELLRYLQKWQFKPLVIAAASNSNRLTYPAAFMETIGVKVAP